jgi:hypothetical protein
LHITVRNSSTISVEVDPSIEYSLRPRPNVERSLQRGAHLLAILRIPSGGKAGIDQQIRDRADVHRKQQHHNAVALAIAEETNARVVAPYKREVPLFSGYLFVWIFDRWYSIENTIGVIRLLSTGDVPSRVPDK